MNFCNAVMNGEDKMNDEKVERVTEDIGDQSWGPTAGFDGKDK